ncbi:hypothetical protein GcM1_247129 [Golovinomyces cichoracearum]|uniref:Uncharacterized protein n=1 Tax=Golovinomyces cichoracearum TaxID=62708 RepID=A0A420IDP5_9PEZI|nr:hypothetical protein GcM1_247129 [Golovinomyces cichoracearum]
MFVSTTKFSTAHCQTRSEQAGVISAHIAVICFWSVNPDVLTLTILANQLRFSRLYCLRHFCTNVLMLTIELYFHTFSIFSCFDPFIVRRIQYGILQSTSEILNTRE